MVVVFEVAGTAERFSTAVGRIPGLEFLGEQQDRDIPPDDDFVIVGRDGPTAADVPESLYVVMTDAQAVTELISLFHRWVAEPTAPFGYGLTPLRTAFELLRDIRRWGPEDRIRDTGLLQDWQETLQVIGGAHSVGVRVEIELWFRAGEDRRAAAQAEVTRLVDRAGGAVVTSAVIEDIAYHGLLATLPHRTVQTVVEGGPGAIELLTTDGVMFVVPAKPMSLPNPRPTTDVAAVVSPGPLPGRPPRVALLDGVPLANHSLLTGRLVVDDPDGIATRYTSAQQQHGTAMASLITHGDLNRPGPALTTQLYVRPILQPHPLIPAQETTVQDELLVDLVHRAFRRMFDTTANMKAVAPSVRIVNLSIGDPARVFVRRLSPLAKLLDWMAHRYNLLVLVSAGNHPIDATVLAAAISDPDQLSRALLLDGQERALHRRLLAPAEANNVLTVGALHDDGSLADLPDTVLSGVEPGLPALYSAVGLGHRRSVKPDLLLPGGRSLFQRPPPGNPADTVTITAAPTAARGPGMLVAAPGNSPEATGYLSGTSNAAALGSRTAHQIFDVLEDLSAGTDEFAFPDAQYHPVLAKTLMVHAATWGPLQAALRDALGLPGATGRGKITPILGYGAVNPEQVASAARTRVVLLGAGSIDKGQRHSYRFPLPGALQTTTQWRRLTVTLAWLSPVNTRTHLHRMARLRFHPPTAQLGVARIEADYNQVVRGTVQHEILEGRDAVAFAIGDALAIDVDCRVDAGNLERPVRYGLAVSIEMAATVSADVHAEVRQQLQIRQRVQTALRVSVQSSS